MGQCGSDYWYKLGDMRSYLLYGGNGPEPEFGDFETMLLDPFAGRLESLLHFVSSRLETLFDFAPRIAESISDFLQGPRVEGVPFVRNIRLNNNNVSASCEARGRKRCGTHSEDSCSRTCDCWRTEGLVFDPLNRFR